MIFFILFGLFVSTSGIENFQWVANPNGPIQKDPKDYEGRVLNFFSAMNNVTESPYYVVPLQIIRAEERLYMETITLHVIVGETDCLKTSEFDSKKCEVNPDADLLLMTVTQRKDEGEYTRTADVIGTIKPITNDNHGTLDNSSPITY